MARLTAWRILRSGSATPLREVNAYCARAGLDERDRGLVRQLVGTEVRRRGTLRALVKLEARGKPSADVAAQQPAPSGVVPPALQPSTAPERRP